MKTLPRRSVVEGIAAAPFLLAAPRSWAASGPTMASEIDLAKAKAEGKVPLYTSLDTKIVDSVIGPFKDKYGIDVEYFRGGSDDVTSKVLAEADAGPHPGRHGRRLRPRGSLGHERARPAQAIKSEVAAG